MLDCLFGRAPLCNFKHASPLGKPAAKGIELSSHSWQRLKTLSPVFLVFVVIQHSQALVYLNAWNDSQTLDIINKSISVIVFLLGSLLVENDP